VKFDQRHGGREAALQILYQWEIGRASIDRTLEAYWTVREEERGDERGEIDREFAERLARGTADVVGELDPLIEKAAEHWRLSRMATVDRLILRLGTYELREDRDTPAPVIINEALELARTFSGEDAVRFINGVLDNVAKTLRPEPSALRPEP
jgi:N utilization substance protein B